MATSTTPTPLLKTAKKRVFDLDKFEKVTKEVQYESPVPFAKVDDFLGMDEATLLGWVNKGRERAALMEAKSSINGASPKLVTQMAAVWRQLPPFSNLLDGLSEGSEDFKNAKREQTKQIYAFFKATPAIIDSLRAAASVATDEDEEETEEE